MPLVCPDVAEKAPPVGAFFVACLLACTLALLLPASLQAAPACRLEVPLQALKVQRVIDGDTLLLEGGQRLRLLAVNAPERGRDGRPDQPGAAEATKLLRHLVRKSEGLAVPARPLLLDRHGRRLALLLDGQGRSLEARLLAAGRVLQVADQRDRRLQGCLARAEAEARRARKGLWAGQPVTSVYALREPGFALLRGTLRQVERRRDALWLELDGLLAVQVAAPVAALLDEGALRAGIGQQVEVRGWVVRRKAAAPTRWLLHLGDPAMLRL